MTREIGSDFALAPDAPTTPHPGASWIQAPSTRRLMSGREALRLLLRDAEDAGRNRLLLPAYLCDSVAQAGSGFEIVWLPVGPDLLPRADALADAVDVAPSRSVVLAVPLFTTPLSEPVEQALDHAEARGASVLEDCTHSLFEGPRRPRAMGSVRKWIPLPDGGLATGSDRSLDAADAECAARRADAMHAKWRFLQGQGGDKDAYLAAFRAWEHELDSAPGVRAMSPRSEALLDAADLPAIAARRRANHAVLREALRASPWIQREVKLFEPEPSEAAVPLGLPVLCRRRDALRRFLIEHRVYCPVHWPLPRAVAEGPFPIAQERNRALMTLVIDQRYDAEDMAHTAALIEEFARA